MNEFLFLENDGSWQEGIVSGNKNFVNLLSHHRLYFHKHQDILIIFCDEKQICGQCTNEKKTIP